MQKNYGYVQDVCADLENGAITSIIVPGSSKILNLLQMQMILLYLGKK